MLFNSQIEIQNQILGAATAVTGTPFSLHYSSDRVRGRCAAYSLEIPLSVESIPPSLKEVRLEVYVAGQIFTKTFPPSPEQSYTFTWDGKDGSGHAITGKQQPKIRIGYVYKALFPRPAITRWTETTASVGTCGSALGLSGWSLDVNHFYDTVGRVLYLGDGGRLSDINVDPSAKISRHRDDTETDIGEFVIAADHANELYVFDPTGCHLSTLHALTAGVLYHFQYDPAGRLIEIKDGDGNFTRLGHPTTETSSEIVGTYGQRTTLRHNSDNHLTSITNASGESVQFSYSKDGLLEGLIDANGNIYRFTYDELGRLIRQEDPTGAVTGLAGKRDNNSSLVALISPLGRESTFLMERLPSGEERRVNRCCGGSEIVELLQGNTRTITFPGGTSVNTIEQPDARFGIQARLLKNQTITTSKGQTSTTTLDQTVTLSDPNNVLSLSSMTETVKINGSNYTNVYDAATRTFTETTPTGRQSRITIDALGKIIQVRLAGLLPINLSYDKNGRLVNVTRGSGSETRTILFTYNSEGYLISTIDSLGRRVDFIRDASGRITHRTLPGNRVIGYTYDANDRIASITPPGRSAHVFAYTPVNRVSAYTPPKMDRGDDQTIYAYDLDQQLTTIRRSDGRTLSLAYDNAGRLSTLTVPEGVCRFTYNPTTGNLSGITAPGGAALSYTYEGSRVTGRIWDGPVAGNVNYIHDNDFRMTSQTVNGGNAIHFTYDNDGLLIGAGSLTLTRNTQNGLIVGTKLGTVTDARTYNGFAELTNYSARFGARDLYLVKYSYDRLGRITQKTETIGGVADLYDYSYDSAGRLAEVKKNGATTATYSYDNNGNRLTGPRDSTIYTYDAQDRLLSTHHPTRAAQHYEYTANGELKSETKGDQTAHYSYDVLGNLRCVMLPGGTQIEYVIDSVNRRIGKRVNETAVQGFLYRNALSPVAELDGCSNVESWFVYGSRANAPDYMIKGGVTYRVVSDHLGSPRLVVDIATGTIAQRLDYDEFGNVLLDTNPGFQPFGFAGGLYDRDTDFVRFGLRDYNAKTGRWTVKDPILFRGGDTNLYGYVLNDPINLIDALGLKCPDPCPSSHDPDKLEIAAAELLEEAVELEHQALVNDYYGLIPFFGIFAKVRSLQALHEAKCLREQATKLRGTAASLRSAIDFISFSSRPPFIRRPNKHPPGWDFIRFEPYGPRMWPKLEPEYPKWPK